jgi:putative ABC transport system permease protein
MLGLRFRLFARIMSRNREVYLLKILTLAIAFASSVLITLFSVNEFGHDKFHKDPNSVFRLLQKNTNEKYSGNRLSSKIPGDIIRHLKASYSDSFLISRLKIMNEVTILAGNQLFRDQKIHAADPNILDTFSFQITDGDASDFDSSKEISVMLSSRAAIKYTGTPHAAGKRIKLHTIDDSIEVKVAAVYKDFPKNSHEDFDVVITFNSEALTTLKFDPEESGVYGRVLQMTPEHYAFSGSTMDSESKMSYRFQSLPQLYFGPRVLGEEARHGDSYSVIILICIAALILFLALTSFINLTTITLPYRSKELAIKKLAGTTQVNLLVSFLKESSTLVGISLLTGLLIIICISGHISSILGLEVLPLIFRFDPTFIGIVSLLFIVLTVSPVLMTMRFVRATPTRLLSTDTITFPRLKRVITFVQLGISIFLIITSVVIRRQINYSLVKEPGQNHDQIVYLNCPSGITNQGIMNLRDGWKKYNPNILDVMAVSQLPDRISSKAIDSDFYLLEVDAGFKEFFGLDMKEGNWFRPNAGDSIRVTNKMGQSLISDHHANVIGVVENLSERFNHPEKPVLIKLANDYNYNWLCVRVLEVDIRRTVEQLSSNFSMGGEIAHVNYLNPHFNSWIDYQDRLNILSGILATISVVLSCFAIYGLSVSLVRDKLKQIAVHKLFGAHTIHITYLLVIEFVKQMVIALVIFGPLTYILLNELLRTFVFATKFSWLDPVYPIAYCAFVIISICGFQALSLSRTDFASALKG